MTNFSNEPWETPENDLSAEDFCAVCLLDLNPSGKEKLKKNCYFPVRKRPGGPVNKAALRNALARIPQADIAAEEKRKAARKAVRLAREAGIEVSEASLRTAGLR